MSWLRFAVFLTVALTIFGGGHLYLYRRLVRDVTEDPRIRRIGRWVAFALCGSLLAAGPIGWVVRNPVSDALGVAAWTWLGVAWYLGLMVAAFGLLRWIGRRATGPRPITSPTRAASSSSASPSPPTSTSALEDPSRRLFLSRAVAGGAAVVSTGLTGYGAFRAYAPAEITELPVKLPHLPRALDGFTIAQVTDIHLGPTIGRRFLGDMVARVNALRPDLVAITGDLVDGSIPQLGPTVAALQNLRARFGSVFVTGNHEYYSGEEAWCAALPGLGIQVLRNRRISIGDAGASFDLLGVDDYSAMGDRPRYDLERAVAARDPERASVLLAHQPKGFELAAARGIGLQLSGHTHGGQMFPFNLLVALATPYTAGLYRHGGAQLYVSRGTGYWGPPFRVGAPPEIVKVVLQPA